MEVEFIEMYEKQPLFRDVDEFLAEQGFSLVDLRRHYWKRKDYYRFRGKGELVFGDALYFKSLDALRQGLSCVEDKTYGRSKIIKGIAICLIYKMFDYSVSVAKTGLDAELLTHNECEGLIAEIKKLSRGKFFSRFHLNGRSYNMLYSLLQKVKPDSYLGWADSDAEIGNVKDI